MSYGVTPFAISLPQLQKVVGSRSKSLLRELREEFEDELQEDREEIEESNEDEFDPGLPLDDALRHLIMDEERWDYEGAKYGYAIEMLCSFYGDILPNDHWTRMNHHWAETVNDMLLEIGVPSETFSILDHLLYRGSPVNIPDIEDFPFVGYVTLDEFPGVLTTLTDERFSRISHKNADEIRVSLEQVREWLETCQRNKSDLVCFYY